MIDVYVFVKRGGRSKTGYLNWLCRARTALGSSELQITSLTKLGESNLEKLGESNVCLRQTL